MACGPWQQHVFKDRRPLPPVLSSAINHLPLVPLLALIILMRPSLLTNEEPLSKENLL